MGLLKRATYYLENLVFAIVDSGYQMDESKELQRNL